MKYLFVLVTLWISFCAERSQSASFESRVAGGDVTSIKRAPYLVAILPDFDFDFNSVICAGSIYNKDWVLTAAQCIASAEQATLVFGSTSLGVVELEGKIINVKPDAFHIFPDYNPKNHSHDFALIKLPYSLIFQENIQPLQLMAPRTPKNLFVGEEAIVSGWGSKSKYLISGHTQLRSEHLFIKDKGSFEAFYKSIINEDEIICATSTACLGDMGSPLVQNGQLIGILSIVPKSGCEVHRKLPVLFTRIDYYYEWIANVIN